MTDAADGDVSGSAEESDIAAARAGDSDAFVRLVLRHEAGLTHYLYWFTRDENAVLDLRQETYLEAYRSLPTYQSRGRFFGWLRCIASRVGYRYWTNLARENEAKRVYLETHLNQCGAAVRAFECDESERAIQLLESLDRLDRALIEMKYFQGMRSTEIATRTGWHVNRIRVRLHRALKKLRKLPVQRSDDAR